MHALRTKPADPTQHVVVPNRSACSRLTAPGRRPRGPIQQLTAIEHEDINSTHEPKSHVLEIDDRSSRVLWRTQRRQDLRVEATLPGFACHLQSQNPGPLDTCRTVE